MRYLIFVIVVGIASCGKQLDRGVIISKWYEPPRTYTYTTTTMCGKIPITQVHEGYDDEDWKIQIEGIIDDDTIHNDIEVTSDEFNSWQVGDSVIVKEEGK